MSTSDVITRAALRLFYRQGFHATGVEQLSQEAGVTKKTLYRHFSSKDHLVEAALELRHNEFMAKVRAAVDAVAVSQRPAGYLDFIASWVQEADFYGCAFINASAEYASLSEQPHRLAHQHKQALQAYLEGICAQAGYMNPRVAAMQLLLIGEGLIVSCQVNGACPELIMAGKEMLVLLSAQRAADPAQRAHPAS